MLIAIIETDVLLNFFLYLSVWLHQVLVAVCRISVASCGIFCFGTWALSLWSMDLFALPRWLSGKESTCQMQVWSLSREDPQRRKWQPTQVFLPGESHRQRSLAGYSPWCGKESDMNEHNSNTKWDLSSLTGDWTQVPCIAGQILNHWTIRKAPFPLLFRALIPSRELHTQDLI